LPIKATIRIKEKRIKMYCTNKAKIIPFPGALFNMANNAQSENTLVNFMNELGYTENREPPERFQNEVDDFLREMGYITAPEKQHIERHIKSVFQ